MSEFVYKTKIQSISFPSDELPEYLRHSIGDNVIIELPTIRITKGGADFIFAGADNIMDVDVEIRFIPRIKEDRL